MASLGDTRGGNSGCHPSIFPEKPGDLFLFIAVTITIAFYCFRSGVTPSRVGCHLFYLSDLVSPLFFVNLPTIFFIRVSPPGRCHPGRSAPRIPYSDTTGLQRVPEITLWPSDNPFFSEVLRGARWTQRMFCNLTRLKRRWSS